MSYQPRYVQFARVRGFEPGSPEAPLLHEFISWIRRKWSAWAAHTGRKGLDGISAEDHAAFDAWLAKETE